jgi:hypothetical protein
MAKPARTDAHPHVAKMWGSLLSRERNRVKPGSSRQRAARPIPSGFLRFFAAALEAGARSRMLPSVTGEKSARGNSRREGGRRRNRVLRALTTTNVEGVVWYGFLLRTASLADSS